ncbi:ATP-dependent Lon protease [Saccharomycopsis crataegensis]|uniref:Lon protease homolog, mitochondrial n=1 Tax=Saccharomycopsis crataegensis TaxID=43959 RepID=A0AAV5QSQ4_9ASCO|nr:ATP-dependent Lon protease [Saccharomycopsis crataegensis]
MAIFSRHVSKLVTANLHATRSRSLINHGRFANSIRNAASISIRPSSHSLGFNEQQNIDEYISSTKYHQVTPDASGFMKNYAGLKEGVAKYHSLTNEALLVEKLNLNKSKEDPVKQDKETSIDKSKDEKPAEKDNEKKKEDGEVESTIKNEDSVSRNSSESSAKSSSSSPSSNNNNNNDNNDGNDRNNKNGKNDSSPGIPKIYPQIMALPISRRPLFPGFYKAVVISDPQVMKAVKQMLEKRQPYIAAFLFKDENAESDVINSPDEIYPVGVFGQITSVFPSKDEKTNVETMTALIYPHKRITLADGKFTPPKSEEEIEVYKTNRAKMFEEEVIADMAKEGKKLVESKDKDLSKDNEAEVTKSEDQNSQYLKEKEVRILEKMDDEEAENPTAFLKNYCVSLVDVSPLEDDPFDKKSPVITALTSEILKVFKEISQLNTMFREQIATFSASIQSATTNIFEEPARLADFAAAVSAGEEKELQEILDSLDIETRLKKSLIVLKKELMNAELQNKISKDVEGKIQKRQREYYLMEQLKGIKRELGIDDGRDKLIETFKKRVEKLKLPEQVEKIFNDELTKLSTLETAMSEFGVVRNYLDWITQLPWGLKSKERYNIPKALKILDEDHYGLKDIKDRILEFIAVGKLLGKVDGKILCFVGPPGVGKTSIAKSIARSLNREYFRFSVGGMTDVAEIKGHRRTYIGALPGKVVQGLKKTQAENPLILIDEIDKIGFAGVHGDPSAALLELLDPEQNNTFMDNYLDVPIDLSKVLFVCTANSLDTIPRPLLDRMEVIEIAGYIAEEKVKIAENYLIPQAKETSGLKNAKVGLTDEAIEVLIKQYCRESGVRNLKKQIEKVYRKAALKVVKQIDTEPPEEESLEDSKQTLSEEKSEDSTKSAKQLADEKVNEEVEEIVKEAEPSDTDVNKSAESLNQESEEPKSSVASEVETGVSKEDQITIPEELNITIAPENLKEYIGPAIYTSDRLYETTIPGVVMGLAWTSMGGTALYVESVLSHPIDENSHAHLERTGQLGDVMKESSTIAYSFAKMFLSKNYPKNRFFEKASIHLHCPEGAVPKDGPSAGVTMASSFLSLALNKPLSPTVAMTGEITLTGKVLKIGGLKEKTIAAKRSGATTVIFPKDNLVDWVELPENVKEGLDYLAADWYGEVFHKIFPDVTAEEGNTVWKKEFDAIDEKKEKKD